MVSCTYTGFGVHWTMIVLDGDHVFEGVPKSLAPDQAKRVVAAIAANPKPWWSPQEGDTKGMFLQIMSDVSFNINHERTLDAHPGPAYAYAQSRFHIGFEHARSL